MACWDILAFSHILPFPASSNYYMPTSVTLEKDKEIPNEGYGIGTAYSLLCCTLPTPLPCEAGMGVLIA